MLHYNYGLSRDLMDTYLYREEDKAVPYTSLSDYSMRTYVKTFENRDPRLKAGKLFAASQEGFYVPAVGPFDVTGDGVPDIAILATPADKESLPAEFQNSLAIYYLENESGGKASYYLSEGTKGHIRFETRRLLTRQFIEPKYYYRPLSLQDKKINPNLRETIFWG